MVGAVVASRNDAGEVTVDEEEAASPVGKAATVGGAAGLVVGLFAPPLLAATAIGAGIGAGIGALKKRHEEKHLVSTSRNTFRRAPRRSSCSWTTCTWIALTGRSASRARRSTRLWTSGDVNQLEKALADADKNVSKAVNF